MRSVRSFTLLPRPHIWPRGCKIDESYLAMFLHEMNGQRIHWQHVSIDNISNYDTTAVHVISALIRKRQLLHCTVPRWVWRAKRAAECSICECRGCRQLNIQCRHPTFIQVTPANSCYDFAIDDSTINTVGESWRGFLDFIDKITSK